MKKAFIFFILFFLITVTAVLAQTETSESSESESKEKSEEVKPPKYEAQLIFSVESLSRNLGTWRTASLYVQRKFDNKQIVWANFRASERRQIRDQELILGVYKPLAKKWAFTAEAMYSPTHKFVGKFSAMGEVEKVFKKGFVGHGGMRFTQYDRVKATIGYGLVEKYWGSNRLAYTLYVTKLSSAGTAPTQRLQYNRYYGERVNTFGAAVAWGREHENLGPGIGILRSDTWSLSLSARHWMTNKFGLNVDASLHRQGNLYYRRGLSFGLRYRF